MPRRAKPWYRSAEDTWYATHDGRQVSLGVRGQTNEAAAWRAWETLRTGQQSQPTIPIPVHHWSTPAPPPQVLVADVVRSFLDDADGRVTAETLKLYRLYLTGFAKKYGKIPAATITCPLAESYSRRPTWNDSTRSVCLAVLARAFYHAERARIIGTPLIGLRKPPIASRAADAMIPRTNTPSCRPRRATSASFWKCSS